MTNEKMISEKEAVMRERAAFVKGASLFYVQKEVPGDLGKVCNRVVARAPELYPLPKVERPRVVRETVSGGMWRFVDGRYEFSSAVGEWIPARGRAFVVPIEDVPAVASLRESPVELVEAEP